MINSSMVTGFLLGIIQGFIFPVSLGLVGFIYKKYNSRLIKIIAPTSLLENLFVLIIISTIIIIHVIITRLIQENVVLPIVFGKYWVLGFTIGIYLYGIYIAFCCH